MAKRSANITKERENDIVEKIKGVRDKISWKILIDILAEEYGETYVEQGLRKHQLIADAYITQRAILTKSRVASKYKEKQASNGERLIKIELENEMLKKENTEYAAKFVLWAHNAYSKHGLTEADLNEPIIKAA